MDGERNEEGFEGLRGDGEWVERGAGGMKDVLEKAISTKEQRLE